MIKGLKRNRKKILWPTKYDENQQFGQYCKAKNAVK